MRTKAADVVFVFPPAYGSLGAFTNHLGVSYLRAALDQESISTIQYLNPSPGTVDEVARDILKHRPRAIGFTAYDANLALCVAIARSVKRRRPDVRVVFGGPSATFCAQQILERQPDVDACVVGEAEGTGPRIFTKLLEQRRDLEDVPPGLAVRRDGEIVGTGLPPLVGWSGAMSPAHSTLDVVPSPYLTGMLDDGRTGILTGRGCTHHCQYCCFAALGRKKLRLHSAERVLAELECIAALQRRRNERYVVPIHDDTFTLLPSRAKSLCHAIIERNLGLVFSCLTRADAIDDELLRLMRAAGFVSVGFGLESAVPSVLRATGKVRPPAWGHADLGPEREFVERVRDGITRAKEYGFIVNVSLIFGLPTETLEDGKATLRFVKDLPYDSYMHNFLWIFPGTPLWQTHDRYGIGCEFDSMGMAATTSYAYDLTKLRPLPRCSLEQDARLIKALAVDALQGCGAALKPEGGTSVAVLRAEELTAETARWLARFLDVGGTFVQIYPASARTRESSRLDEDRRTLNGCLVPNGHHIQMVPRRDRDGNARWKLASPDLGFYPTHRPETVSLTTSDSAAPFLDWLTGAASGCALCDLSDALRRPTKLLRLLDRAGRRGVGRRLRDMPVPPGLTYPGRWLAGTAPCLSLTRIEIDREGRVRPCRHGEPIGSVGDSRPVLRRRLAALAAEAAARRGCTECPHADCPRCPFPGMDDDTYCRLMGSHRRARDVVKWAHAYSRLPSVLVVERDRVAGH